MLRTAYIDLSEPVDKVSRLAAALEAKEARKQADSSALIPSRGGLPMVVARNAGEAKEARKAQREFREVRKFNDHFTRVAKVHNHQKHVSCSSQRALGHTRASQRHTAECSLILPLCSTVPRPPPPIDAGPRCVTLSIPAFPCVVPCPCHDRSSVWSDMMSRPS